MRLHEAASFCHCVMGIPCDPHNKYNTGVVVTRPSMAIYDTLVDYMNTNEMYTCKDGFQSMWNDLYGKKTGCLDLIYNCRDHNWFGSPTRDHPTSCGNSSEVALIHFSGKDKPWLPSHGKNKGWAYGLWHQYAERQEIVQVLEDPKANRRSNFPS